MLKYIINIKRKTLMGQHSTKHWGIEQKFKGESYKWNLLHYIFYTHKIDTCAKLGAFAIHVCEIDQLIMVLHSQTLHCCKEDSLRI